MVTNPAHDDRGNSLVLWHPAAGLRACTAFLMLGPTCILTGGFVSQVLCSQSFAAPISSLSHLPVWPRLSLAAARILQVCP